MRFDRCHADDSAPRLAFRRWRRAIGKERPPKSSETSEVFAYLSTSTEAGQSAALTIAREGTNNGDASEVHRLQAEQSPDPCGGHHDDPLPRWSCWSHWSG